MSTNLAAVAGAAAATVSGGGRFAAFYCRIYYWTETKKTKKNKKIMQ